MAWSAAERFPERADFVRRPEDPAFPVAGHDDPQRKHMGADHVFLHGIQRKIPFGIPIRPRGMVKSVEPVPFCGNVPIVEEIIVQQCAADEGTEPELVRPRENMRVPQRDLHGTHRNGKGMVVYGYGAMLDEVLFRTHPLREENIRAVFCDDFLRVVCHKRYFRVKHSDTVDSIAQSRTFVKGAAAGEGHGHRRHVGGFCVQTVFPEGIWSRAKD